MSATTGALAPLETSILQPHDEVSCRPAQGGGAPSCHVSREERQLIQACQQGDRNAWDALIHRCEKLVYRFAYALSGNYDDTAEIVGQVFLRLYEGIHTFREEAYFTSWLYSIVRNAYIDTCVRAPYQRDLSLDTAMEAEEEWSPHEVSEPARSPEEWYMQAERYKVLWAAIRHLPAYQRRIMQMYYGERRSYEEIARVTGLATGTVKSRLSRARQMLKERLLPLQE